jgi:hypothetical protein
MFNLRLAMAYAMPIVIGNTTETGILLNWARNLAIFAEDERYGGWGADRNQIHGGRSGLCFHAKADFVRIGPQ